MIDRWLVLFGSSMPSLVHTPVSLFRAKSSALRHAMARTILVLLVLVSGLAPANADELSDMARQLGVSELRAGVMLHDFETWQAIVPRNETIDYSNWQNLNLEVLFNPPDADIVRWLGSPRIALTTDLNFAGKDSTASLSAVWHLPVFDSPLFVEPVLGGTIHNGYLRNAPIGRRNLGCRALFHLGFNVGAEITDKMTAMFSLEHSSHFWLCGSSTNDGINRMGFRVGWKLD